MAETAFSSLKRLFGEHVSARRMENMVRELMLKASLYSIFIGLTATPLGLEGQERSKEMGEEKPLKP